MTEMAEKTGSEAVAQNAVERFILHWGDLGATWGVNRSVAQIHALLLVSDRPLTAEAICDRLGLARSNVSGSVKELQGWGLVRREPIAGDRRDHFVAVGDAWDMAAKIVAIRKAREIDPAKAILKSCLADVADDPAASDAAVRRLRDINDTIDLLDDWYAEMKDLPRETAVSLLGLGRRAVEFLRPFLKKKAVDGAN
ncbi:MAG: MarR family transcriptional regulator [Alphaproteobacteria bacterium]|nr:MarR family transcriptional regulator [Alphaproteobacteria bacterium]